MKSAKKFLAQAGERNEYEWVCSNPRELTMLEVTLFERLVTLVLFGTGADFLLMALLTLELECTAADGFESVLHPNNDQKRVFGPTNQIRLD